MTEIPYIPSMRPEPERDKYGRYRLPDPLQGGDVRSWTRATTIAHALDDEFHLTQWKRRMVLTGAALAPGVLANVPELARALERAGDDWRAAKDIKAELDSLCDSAAETAGAGDGAKLGTLLHTITEYYDAGRLDEIRHLIPEQLLGDLNAYVMAMAEAGLQCPPEFIERIVVNSRVEGAGTFDRLLQIPVPCPICGGTLQVGDVKSQKSVDFGWLSIAIQLGEYAQADAIYDDETKSLVPMPAELCKCVGIVMHVPVGQATCTLYELDLVAGWEAALAAQEVRTWRQRSKGLGRVYVPRTAPVGDKVLRLINSAGHPDALRALWADLHPKGQWTAAHTAAAEAQIAALAAG